MALASASTDAGICLEIYKSLPPSDGCASGMAFMLINHGRFVFKRTHHGTCSKVFPGAVSLKWDLRLLALLSWGTWSRPFCGFPVLCGCLGASGPLASSQVPSPSCLLALHAGGI